jgi:cobalt-zinc-cadmium efflux system protein
VELAEVEAALLAIPGVCEVHELHVWAITSGRNSLTAHLSLDDSGRSEQAVRLDAARILKSRFNIAHTTVQVEAESCRPANPCSLTGTEEEHSHEGEAH